MMEQVQLNTQLMLEGNWFKGWYFRFHKNQNIGNSVSILFLESSPVDEYWSGVFEINSFFPAYTFLPN